MQDEESRYLPRRPELVATESDAPLETMPESVVQTSSPDRDLHPGEATDPTVVVSNSTGKSVKAQVSFVEDHRGQQPNDDDGIAEGEDREFKADGGLIVTNPLELSEAKKKKKKKNRKSASKRGIGKPTGMEEFYADAPMTPAEYEQERQLYDPDLPFLDRVLTAIQRFERTRKLTPERRDVFYKWLHYGGIVIAPNIGTGGQDLEEMDNDQIATALSQVRIPDELKEDLESAMSDEPKYAIDFLGCMQSFLSRAAPAIFAFENKQLVDQVTTTCERFMDYLLQHDVLPECQEEILTTRNFCREAGLEMWSCAEAQRWLPGDFNIACSTLFGGSYSRSVGATGEWDYDTIDGSAVFVGLSTEEATEILGFGVAGAASEEVYDSYLKLNQEEGLEVVKVIEGKGFEITDLENPTADCKDLYKNNSTKYRPVGRVTAKAWQNPNAPPEDLTKEEKEAAKNGKGSTEQYVFFIEGIVLQHLSVGQRIMATVRELNCGIWFFDDFTQIYADFDVWLLNELVEGYKEPRWLAGAYAPGAPGWGDQVTDGEDKATDEQAEQDRQGFDGSLSRAVNNADEERDAIAVDAGKPS